MDEEQKAALNEVLNELARRALERPEAEVVYFQPDVRKAGGEYVKKRGRVRRIDEVARRIIFADGEKVAIDEVIRISLCAHGDEAADDA